MKNGEIEKHTEKYSSYKFQIDRFNKLITYIDAFLAKNVNKHKFKEKKSRSKSKILGSK
jgi:hypothetical protein